jgi:hypothetical protein
MNGLILNSNGTKRIFRPDGKVALAGTAGDQVKGSWKSTTDRAANRIQYDFDGAQSDFEVRYSFNDTNQLVALIPAAANGGANSEPFTFSGKIVIDDNRDIAYVLLNETGTATKDGPKIIVYGELALVPGLDKMTIELAGGGTASIRGSNPRSNNLSVDRNPVEGQEDDQIQFAAATINTTGGKDILVPAEIKFGGHWDVNDKGLYFSAGLKQGAVNIQLAGSYKGVTAGLEYSAKNGNKTVSFTVKGEHQFKPAGGGATSANWLLKLGHQGTKIEAIANVGITHIDRQGNKLTLGGNFQFVRDGQATASDMTLELNAAYEMRDGGKLVFLADLHSDGSRISYHLMLQGDYKVRGTQVNFLIKLGQEQSGERNLEFSLGTTGDRAVKAHLAAILRQSPTGETSVDINFDVSVRWVDGEMVKPGELPKMEVDKPKVLPAGAT